TLHGRTEKEWHSIEFKLLDQVREDGGEVKASGYVYVPAGNPSFALISDMDDTIITTHATSLFQMLKLTLFNNAHTRLPFKGVAQFYSALKQGKGGTEKNPIFYVSSGPWNLYDLIIKFMEAHAIPVGPLIMQDFGIDKFKFVKSAHIKHKTDVINRLLKFYPELPFILVGDSGERDPEIYAEIVKNKPGRIKVIYIRDVSRRKRKKEINELSEKLQELGTDMILVENSLEAAVHAAFNKMISMDALETIRRGKIKDEAAPADVRQLFSKRS
ncbi:MAG: phosphatase domain-containing protein, partial [Calditrichia bacterium]